MVIITGAGRSGTSALSGYIFRLGYNTGNTYGEGIRGGYELAKISIINDRIIAGETVYDSEIQELDNIIIKDPRFFDYPVLDRWIEARDDLSFIISYRSPVNVAKGYRRHPDQFLGKGTTPLKELSETIYDNSAYVFHKLSEEDIEFRVLTFPTFLDQFEKVTQTFEEMLGEKFNRIQAKACWDEWMDESKVHYR
ncbi:MAG: hypothetical protein AAGC72_03945 [Planctomycetota bacterium]